MTVKAQATIEDLLNCPDHGRAELVCGKIVMMPPMTWRASRMYNRTTEAQLF